MVPFAIGGQLVDEHYMGVSGTLIRRVGQKRSPLWIPWQGTEAAQALKPLQSAAQSKSTHSNVAGKALQLSYMKRTFHLL